MIIGILVGMTLFSEGFVARFFDVLFQRVRRRRGVRSAMADTDFCNFEAIVQERQARRRRRETIGEWYAWWRERAYRKVHEVSADKKDKVALGLYKERACRAEQLRDEAIADLKEAQEDNEKLEKKLLDKMEEIERLHELNWGLGQRLAEIADTQPELGTGGMLQQKLANAQTATPTIGNNEFVIFWLGTTAWEATGRNCKQWICSLWGWEPHLGKPQQTTTRYLVAWELS